MTPHDSERPSSPGLKPRRSSAPNSPENPERRDFSPGVTNQDANPERRGLDPERRGFSPGGATEPLIVAERVSKRFEIHHNYAASIKERVLGVFHRRHRMTTEDFWALRDVDLHVDRGESVGLVGRNGSGKSTLLKLIAGIYRPTSGRLLVLRGARIGTMIELGVGFHPELSGRENVYLNASVYGLTREEVDGIYDAVVDYAELAQFIDEPIKNYSSGMIVRLAFAVAAHLDPEVLLLDEIFAVGDAAFQEKCKQTMQGFLEKGRTILFVSHSAASVAEMCQRVCVLDHGVKVYDGPTAEGLELYEGLSK
jgi:ABC-2 type transport system ATP-binding protein